jgi:hypothetical protein
MILTNSSRFSQTLLITALLITIFLLSDAPAQAQSCDCYNPANSVTVYRPAPRRVSYYRPRARRTYRRARVARVRTVYRTVYVTAPPTTASYISNAADTCDCNDAIQTTSRVLVTEPDYGDSYASASYVNAVARGWGHRDGFKDGYKAALKFRAYDPENNSDFRDANNGYKRQFGSKYLYRSEYREGYVRGYQSGYRSVNGGETYGKY